MAKEQLNTKTGPKVRMALNIFYALPVILVLGLCGYVLWNRATHQAPPVRHISSKPFTSVSIDGLIVNLFAQGEQLRPTGDDLFVEFRDRQNQLVDVGEVTFELSLKMPDMVMHSMGKVMRTATPGQYRTTLEPQVAGDWTARIGFSGPRGKAEVAFQTAVK